MPLERQIGAVELQQKAAPDDRLVLLLERGTERVEIGFLAVVIFILHRRGDDTRGWRREERLDKVRTGLVERRREIGAFGFDRASAEIADFSNRLRRAHIAHRSARRELLFHHLPEHRIAQRVGTSAALPGAAKAAHPMADVEKETLALLLAVVAEIDPRFHLLAHDRAQ